MAVCLLVLSLVYALEFCLENGVACSEQRLLTLVKVTKTVLHTHAHRQSLIDTLARLLQVVSS